MTKTTLPKRAGAPPAASPDAILQLGFGFWGSKALLSAVELGVFTALAGTSADLETLRARLGLHPRSARDFLDALVALGMLQRQDGRYANTPATEAFLDRAKPGYLGGILEMANARLFGFWADLTEGLRTGRPQNETKTGGSFFPELYADPTRLRAFARAMTALSMGSIIAIGERFPWSGYRTFADIGCAEGGLGVQLAGRHAHLTGVGLDLPALGPVFEEHVSAAGLSERLRFQEGDFLTEELPAADVLVFGHVLHDWGLDTKRLLIERAYRALSEDGAIICYDAVIDDDRRQNVFGLLMSLNMLIELPDGFDYTGAQCQQWLHEAGFRRTSVEHLAGPESMVVGIK
jgi:SAM-dependent methyltransferase